MISQHSQQRKSGLPEEANIKNKKRLKRVSSKSSPTNPTLSLGTKSSPFNKATMQAVCAKGGLFDINMHRTIVTMDSE